MEIEAQHELWRNVGPLLPDIGEIIADASQKWILVMEDSLVISVEFIALSSRYLCKINLGKFNGENPLEIYETLLSYNLLIEETRGVRMGIDGPNGDVWLLFEIELINNDAYKLAENLTYIATFARGWMRLLQDPSLLKQGTEKVDVLNIYGKCV
jgi:hypothetical protein